nr:hypothetical protein Iba_chr04fCG3130 [Ipomoea batatas]
MHGAPAVLPRRRSSTVCGHRHYFCAKNGFPEPTIFVLSVVSTITRIINAASKVRMKTNLRWQTKPEVRQPEEKDDEIVATGIWKATRKPRKRMGHGCWHLNEETKLQRDKPHTRRKRKSDKPGNKGAEVGSSRYALLVKALNEEKMDAHETLSNDMHVQHEVETTNNTKPVAKLEGKGKRTHEKTTKPKVQSKPNEAVIENTHVVVRGQSRGKQVQRYTINNAIFEQEFLGLEKLKSP